VIIAGGIFSSGRDTMYFWLLPAHARRFPTGMSSPGRG
jgi:hypothetical protein